MAVPVDVLMTPAVDDDAVARAADVVAVAHVWPASVDCWSE